MADERPSEMRVQPASTQFTRSNTRSAVEGDVDRESALDMVRRHIAESERHIETQHRIIAALQRLGADTAVAEQMLVQLDDLITEHRRHLSRLEGAP